VSLTSKDLFLMMKISILCLLPFSFVQSFTVNAPSSALRRRSVGLRYGAQEQEQPQQSFVVREFSMFEQLEEVVKLAARPMPERPDGLVTVVKFTSAFRPECSQTEAEYERLARKHPDTVFLRCYEEYDDADLVLSRANISTYPTFDIFYKENRIARIEGPEYASVEEQVLRHGIMNSKLDLFSEEADNKKRLAWGDGKLNPDYSATPRTTARFILGYDWNSDKGFFDDMATKAQESFEGQYENWVPPMDDDKKR